MDAPLYNLEGSKVGTVPLSEKVFGVRWKPNLVHEVILIMQSSRRAGTAHTKGRSDVRGGGKKPWQQKGTGRARHGSIRSPLWVGGGVTHGPIKEKNFARKINKKVRSRALATVLSRKLHEGEVIFLENIAFPEVKTKLAASTLKKLASAIGRERLAAKGGRTLVLIGKSEPETTRALRNLPFVEVDESRNLNAEKALTPKYLIITKEAIEKIPV